MVANGFFSIAQNWAWDLAELATRDGLSLKCKGLMLNGGGTIDPAIVTPWVGNSMKAADCDDDDDDEAEATGQQGSNDKSSVGPAPQGGASQFHTPTIPTTAGAPSPSSASTARAASRTARPLVSPRPNLPPAKIKGLIKNARS